ncbi:hypothetical protein ABPG75_007662 [Micractinium tetrahymenae]
MAAPGLPGLMPVIVQENWVQCENPNCNKWRKVPPGYQPKEDEPWYCYLNPDDRKGTCSASEEEYKEAIEISAPADAEEAEHNRLIRERLTAGLLASTSGGKGGRGRGKGRGGRGRGRGRQSAAGRGGGGAAAEPSSVDYFAGRRVKPGAPNYREDSDDDLDFLSEEKEEEPQAPLSGGRSARRQQSAYTKHFQRLLENQGSWEAARGHTTAGGAAPHMPPPAEAWEGLGQHAPELAELACSAADVASSLQYFEGSVLGGVPGSDAADAVARLSAMLASAAALVETEDSLTPEERRACCLDAAAAGPAAAAAAGAPLSIPAPFQQQQQPAASMAAAAGWQQQAAAFFPRMSVLQPAAQHLGAGMPQQGMPAGVGGWPPLPVPNGQQQQQAAAQQFAQLQPAAQQWQTTAAQPGMQPFGMPMQQQDQQQLGGMPLMPGVSPEMVAQYSAMLAQKPAGGPQANGGLAGMR